MILFRLLVLLLASLFTLAAAEKSVSANAHELGQKILTALQTGKTAEVKSNATNYIPILERGISDNPTDPLIHFGLAFCYEGVDKKIVALEHMKKAYVLSKKDPLVGTLYALFLKMDKQPLKAYDVDKEVVSLHPEAPRLKISLATMDLTIQKYDEALLLIQQLSKVAPTNLPPIDRSTLLMMEGTCYLYQGKHSNAIEVLKKSVSAYPNILARIMLGEAYLKHNDLTEAKLNLDKALAINSRVPSALYYKGICLEKAKDEVGAKKLFEDAYTAQKARLGDNGEDYFLMHLICQKLGKPEEAARYKADAEKLMVTFEAPWEQ